MSESKIFHIGIVSRSTYRKIADLVLHLYVEADDPLAAGAISAELLNKLQLEFRSYTYIPHVVSEDELPDLHEHLQAFVRAKESGLSYLISQIYSEDGLSLPLD